MFNSSIMMLMFSMVGLVGCGRIFEPREFRG